MANLKHSQYHSQYAVQADLIDRLFSSLPAILINLTLMPIVVCAVMWRRVPHQILFGWLVVAFLVLIGRFLLARYYRQRKPVEGDYRRWAYYFTLSSLVSGLTWGFAGWVFFQPQLQGALVFLYVCIIGLSAGSIIVTSYWLPAYYAYAVPSVGLSALRLMIEPNFEYQSLGVLILMYLVIITRVARIQHQCAIDLAELRFANLDLVEQLKLEKQTVEAANHDLDQRVQERTIALEAEVIERRNAEAKLDRLAHHDPLTDLPNRLMFAEICAQRIQRAQSTQQPLAILFIDLDRFKEVNDTLGHALGDQLLVAVAQRLISLQAAQHFLARLGGDEFIYVLENASTNAEIQQFAENTITTLSQVFHLAGHELYLSASIGICKYPQDGHNVDTLVRNADTAMYRAKADGRGRSHFYTPEMTALAQERVQLDTMLRRALAQQELAAFYQLKVDMHGVPTGAEVLMRWHQPTLGQVAPAKFIPIAEETGFIVPLGDWILKEACQQMMAWQAQGIDLPSISVNLSVKQLEHGNIVMRLQQILQETGLPAHRLELEITESIIMNVENGAAILKAITALGVQLSIDDFGTGYSSLAYLKALPIDTLKIDRSFVAGIGVSVGDESIIRAIVALANSLGMLTVAEGVETLAQYHFLQLCGVNQMQGYHFAKPENAADFAQHWQYAKLQHTS